MNNKLSQFLLAATTVAALVAVAAWNDGRGALNESRTRVVANLLEPAAALLKENQALIKDLQAEPDVDKEGGILMAYLARIRRDGVPKHAATRQRLEQLADNNVAIATLLAGYLPHARTPVLQPELDKFRSYAAAWRARWNAVMEVFMAGGTFASAELPFPADLPDKVQAEIAASR